MKKMLLLIVVVIVGVMAYFAITPNFNSDRKVEKEIESKDNHHVLDTQNKTQLNQKDNKHTISNSKQILQKTNVKKNVEIKTDSKVLKDLYNSLINGDRKIFSTLYNAKIKELRDKNRDNSLFYHQFRALFLENDISNSNKIALLWLLGHVGTKESISLLFEMTEDGTLDSSDMELMGDIANDIIKRSADYIKEGGGWSALIDGYKNSTNRWIMLAAAKDIGTYPSDKVLEMLIDDYAHTDNEDRKWAALVGLEQVKNRDSLPLLRKLLYSSDKKIQKTTAMTLSYMTSLPNPSSEVLQEWIMERATIDDLDDIKGWYKRIIQYTDPYVISKNIVIEKIRDKELQDELKLFIEDAIEVHEEKMKEL